MTDLFTLGEASIFIRLLTAHLLADFYLQKSSWVKSKEEKNLASAYLWLHAGIAALLAWIFLWNINYWWVFIITFITHALIDAWKIKATNTVFSIHTISFTNKAKKELHLFIVDQCFHFIIIIILWLSIIKGWQKFGFAIDDVLPNYHFLLLLTAYLLVLQPTGYVIGFITKRWLPELNMKDSLQDAGKWIGMLERAIVLSLIFTNQYSSIGFLIAAKSILRVTDKPEKNIDNEATTFSSRKHTEYVLIGTFLSFGCALLIGILTSFLIRLH